MKWSRACVDFF